MKCADPYDHVYALRFLFANGDSFPVDYPLSKIDLLLSILTFSCEEFCERDVASLDLGRRFSRRFMDYRVTSEMVIHWLELDEGPASFWC